MGLHGMSRRTALKLGLGGMALGLAGRAAQAQTVEEFYKGNTVTLVISAAPGGASDFFARLFAPFFARHIPGQPQVIVTNLAGASGMMCCFAALIRLRLARWRTSSLKHSCFHSSTWVADIVSLRVAQDWMPVALLGAARSDSVVRLTSPPLA